MGKSANRQFYIIVSVNSSRSMLYHKFTDIEIHYNLDLNPEGPYNRGALNP